MEMKSIATHPLFGLETSLSHWRFWIDRGGTFTDVVALTPDHRIVCHKLLSQNDHYDDAALEGIRQLLQVTRKAPLPPEKIKEIRMGTTVATNALLERRGEPTVLLITAGLEDALLIGQQERERLFALKPERSEPLYRRVIGIRERVAADGKLVDAIDTQSARIGLETAFAEGFRACAIVLLHADRHPAHELTLAGLAREAGFTQISMSHEVSPMIRLIPRGDTAVADAYLSPVLNRYVAQVQKGTGNISLRFMRSSGGLADAGAFRGKDAVLSGPAGGIVGAVETARAAGHERIIGFDMGGTSTDVCHSLGDYPRQQEARVAGVRLRTPMMEIHTVAAGGGSIISFDGYRLRVGPQSAGALPGPACYGHGGPLTVTDANLMTGRIDTASFPRLFGADGQSPLDQGTVVAAFSELAARINAASGQNRDAAMVAEDCLELANEAMAQAIRQITTQRGFDVSDHTLVAFGGAGGQHACAVADKLGISRVFLHPLAGVLSALGIGLASLRSIQQSAVEQALAAFDVNLLASQRQALFDTARKELSAQVDLESVTLECQCRLRLRVTGRDAGLDVNWPEDALADPFPVLRENFDQAHRQRYGFAADTDRLILESIELELIAHEPRPAFPSLATRQGAELTARGAVRFRSGGLDATAPVFHREDLRGGDLIPGPALIAEPTGTVIIDPGWTASVAGGGHLELRRVAPLANRRPADSRQSDPLWLELFSQLFMAIAERMGVTLQQTSQSVNIKERLDFSCAVFDGQGHLIANAPHMPVHLGSMGESVRSIIERFGDGARPGDAWALNAPYAGGTHLPDITVVSPVFCEGASTPAFWVASRGHHADLGGLTPGSMPPQSTDIREEGVLFDGVPLLRQGRFLEDELRERLLAGPWPARRPEQNLADLQAQLAANAQGIEELRAAVTRYGLDVVSAYMQHLQDYTEAAVRRAISKLHDGQCSTKLDDGSVINVSIRVDQRDHSAVIDFDGTSAQCAGNLNAPRSVARAAVMYVFRCLLDEDLPLNEGCARPLQIRIPEASLLSPQFPAAVVAGNVETSQAITDALFGALGVMAAAQGTMNNLTFGNARYQYYETICGGSGAGADFDGTDAIQTHMTNSRLTDPEILETRFPVRLERFAVRHGSGGRGQHHGGDGVIREMRFLEAMEVGLLANRRREQPFGLCGGEPGQSGLDRLIRADGTEQVLQPGNPVSVESGDRIRIETPGGGGYGKAGD